jgi:hypothetical protein
MHSIRCDKIALNFPRKKMMGQHWQALHRVKLSPLQLGLDHWRLEKLTFEKPQYLLMKHCQNAVAAVAAYYTRVQILVWMQNGLGMLQEPHCMPH